MKGDCRQKHCSAKCRNNNNPRRFLRLWYNTSNFFFGYYLHTTYENYTVDVNYIPYIYTIESIKKYFTREKMKKMEKKSSQG